MKSMEYASTTTTRQRETNLLTIPPYWDPFKKMQSQRGLVQDYCQGSGTKLNLTKSILLPLNRNHACPSLPAVRVLGRTDTVKYLGIQCASPR